jgi:hypothetical protein
MDPALVRRVHEIMSGALWESGTRVPMKNLFDFLEGASSLESAEHDITTGFVFVLDASAGTSLWLQRH